MLVSRSGSAPSAMREPDVELRQFYAEIGESSHDHTVGYEIGDRGPWPWRQGLFFILLPFWLPRPGIRFSYPTAFP